MEWDPNVEYEVVCMIGGQSIATRATKLQWHEGPGILSLMGADGRMRWLSTPIFHVTEVSPSGVVRATPAEPLSLVRPS